MDCADRLTEQQLDLIRQKILPGEVLRWLGHEPRGKFLKHRIFRISRLIILTILASLFAASMSIINPDFWRKSLPNMLPVLIPAVLAILSTFLLGQEIIQPAKSGVDLYAITNRRALVISNGSKHRLWSYGPDIVKTAQVRHRKDGSGDIIFESNFHWSTDKEGRSTWQSRKVGFFGLKSVDEINCLLHQIQ